MKQKMQKIISMIVAIALIITMLPSYSLAAALESNEEASEQDLYVVEEVEASEDLGIQLSEELEMNVLHVDEESVELEMNMTAEDVDVSAILEMDRETETFLVSGEVNTEEEGTTEQVFEVVVHESEGDLFHATFVDVETGERFEVNTSELNASVVPIILGVIAREGIKFAIKKYGKKAVQKATKSAAKKAVKKAAPKKKAPKKSASKNTQKKSGSKGSTGRSEPKNLNEQLAMKSVRANPFPGSRVVVNKSKMKDPRWPGSKGWEKRQRTFTVGTGRDKKTITIHFNYNTVTKKFDDFKFK